jgi:long-chain acyl-CoA synthetase
MPSDFIIPFWLRDAAAAAPDRPWLITGDGSLTFAEAWTHVQALAGGLQGRGVGPAERVVILSENGAAGVLLFFATLLAGGTAVVLHPQIKPEGLRRIMAQTTPKVALVDHTTEALTGELASALILRGLAELPSGAWQLMPLANEPAFLVFTSGSTGTPRGVMLMHEGVRFVSEAIQSRLNYQESDRVGVFLPLSFDVGLYQLFFSLMRRCAVYLGRPEMAGPELPRVLAAEAVTVLPAVPTLLAGLIKMQRFRPVALPDLRMVTSTGDHLAAGHISALRDLLPHVSVFPMYGLTECKRVSILLPDEVDEKPGSVGRALDGTRVFAMDAEGRELPAGAYGELGICGPHLAAGYWQAPEETQQRYRVYNGQRVLVSGDFGHVDDEGYLYLSGRAEFVIKHRGFRMSPAEIEEAACELPLIAEAGCVKDEATDRLCLFVGSASHLNVQTLRQALSERLEPAKVPDHIQVLAQLPRTANQKVDRKALRALLS